MIAIILEIAIINNSYHYRTVPTPRGPKAGELQVRSGGNKCAPSSKAEVRSAACLKSSASAEASRTRRARRFDAVEQRCGKREREETAGHAGRAEPCAANVERSDLSTLRFWISEGFTQAESQS